MKRDKWYPTRSLNLQIIGQQQTAARVLKKEFSIMSRIPIIIIVSILSKIPGRKELIPSLLLLFPTLHAKSPSSHPNPSLSPGTPSFMGRNMATIQEQALRLLDATLHCESRSGSWVFEGCEQEASSIFYSSRSAILANKYTSLEAFRKVLEQEVLSLTSLSPQASGALKLVLQSHEEEPRMATLDRYDLTLGNTLLYLQVGTT